MKKCIHCEEIKSLTNFSKHPKTKDKHRTICKKCEVKYSEEWYRKNKERAKEIQKRYGARCRADKIINKKILLNHIYYKYGKSVVKRLYKKYDNHCAVCNSEKVLCIHHKDVVGMYNYKKLNKPVNNELDNLLLVCRSCHRKIHCNLQKK